RFAELARAVRPRARIRRSNGERTHLPTPAPARPDAGWPHTRARAALGEAEAAPATNPTRPPKAPRRYPGTTPKAALQPRGYRAAPNSPNGATSLSAAAGYSDGPGCASNSCTTGPLVEPNARHVRRPDQQRASLHRPVLRRARRTLVHNADLRGTPARRHRP